MAIIDTSAWLTPKEVQAILRYRNVSSVTDKIIAGEFRYMNRGTKRLPSYLIDPESVAAWQRSRIAGQSNKTCPAPSPPVPWPAGIKKLI